MPSLPERQAAFAAALLAPGGAPGMRVYRGNVFGNWSKALASAYPIVRKILGADFFDGMADAYARAHRAVSGDLNQYGERLPGFLAGFTHTQDLPYLPDVARMEWFAHRACYAADPAPFDFATPVSGDPGLRLAPSCALLESSWPLERIWTVHQDDYAGAIDVDLRSGPDRILVWRPGWRARVRSLPPGDFRFLSAAAAGTTLGEALEAAATDLDFDVAGALAAWVDAGVIVSLEGRSWS